MRLPPPHRQTLMEECYMARAVFPHEVTDPDFQWLLSTYCEAHPAAMMIDISCVPVVVLLFDQRIAITQEHGATGGLLALPPGQGEEGDASAQKK